MSETGNAHREHLELRQNPPHNSPRESLLIERSPRIKRVLLCRDPLWVWCLSAGPIAAAMAWGASGLPLAVGLASFVFGLLYWSFVEYAIHRWIYHVVIRHSGLRALVHSLHLHHHRHLNDHSVLNAGPLLAYPTTLVLLSPVVLASGFQWQLAAGVGLGLAVHYGLYEIVHFAIHYRVHQRGYLSWIQRYHLFHHERRWTRNFGNTSPLWDVAFGTYDRGFRGYRLNARSRANLIVKDTCTRN